MFFAPRFLPEQGRYISPLGNNNERRWLGYVCNELTDVDICVEQYEKMYLSRLRQYYLEMKFVGWTGRCRNSTGVENVRKCYCICFLCSVFYVFCVFGNHPILLKLNLTKKCDVNQHTDERSNKNLTHSLTYHSSCYTYTNYMKPVSKFAWRSPLLIELFRSGARLNGKISQVSYIRTYFSLLSSVPNLLLW